MNPQSPWWSFWRTPRQPVPKPELKGKQVIYNKVSLGEILQSEDGFYQWYPDDSRKGYIPAHILRGIADILDEKNKPWRDLIKKEIGG